LKWGANLFKHRVTVVGSIDYSPRYHPKVGNHDPTGSLGNGLSLAQLFCHPVMDGNVRQCLLKFS